MRIIERECRLLGLDLPVRTELSGPGGTPVQVESASLHELERLIDLGGGLPWPPLQGASTQASSAVRCRVAERGGPCCNAGATVLPRSPGVKELVMKFSRLICVAVPLALAVCAAGAPPAGARPPVVSRDGSDCPAWERGYEDATVPAIGQTWTADFGVDTPLGPGPFVATIAFHSATTATITVAKGPGTLQGLTQDITYASTRLRTCQYALTWHEPVTGVYATQVEDYAEHRVYDTIVNGTRLFHMTGTFYRTG